MTDDNSELVNASIDIIERLVGMASQDHYEDKNNELMIVQVRYN